MGEEVNLKCKFFDTHALSTQQQQQQQKQTAAAA
jgi:hypothetical protein